MPMDNGRSSRVLETAIIVAALFATNLAGQFLQPRISTGDGKGWDGVAYYSIAEQFTRGESPRGEAPFVHRIGTPLLASWICPKDLLQGFKIVNIAANCL